MKNRYTTLALCFLAITIQAQTFDFSLSFIGVNSGTNNYQMALVATPSTSVTNGGTADMGAGFYLPSGLTIGNFVTGDSGIPGSEWSTMSLGSNANGDAIFISRVEAGAMSTTLNGSGPFQLALFDVIADPNPTTGSIIFMENGDMLMTNNFVENYINIDLGGPVNAYAQNDPAANSIDFSTLGLENNKLTNNSVSVYPNPTSDIINISSRVEITSLELFNILGKKVMVSKSVTDKLNISEFPTGIYLLKISTANGDLTKKVIIE